MHATTLVLHGSSNAKSLIQLAMHNAARRYAKWIIKVELVFGLMLSAMRMFFMDAIRKHLA